MTVAAADSSDTGLLIRCSCLASSSSPVQDWSGSKGAESQLRDSGFSSDLSSCPKWYVEGCSPSHQVFLLPSAVPPQLSCLFCRIQGAPRSTAGKLAHFLSPVRRCSGLQQTWEWLGTQRPAWAVTPSPMGPSASLLFRVCLYQTLASRQ